MANSGGETGNFVAHNRELNQPIRDVSGNLKLSRRRQAACCDCLVETTAALPGTIAWDLDRKMAAMHDLNDWRRRGLVAANSPAAGPLL
jgi:hypothetical protein